mmetsp:Transcript_27403/g.27639  ORF Transcript_27403/g.27639 Transcript_27403/m.27639 type:complete len:301 (-) Transcript_27403:248-1150(-)
MHPYTQRVNYVYRKTESNQFYDLLNDFRLTELPLVSVNGSSRALGVKLCAAKKVIPNSTLVTPQREYLDDYKPFYDIFSYKSLSLQVMKAGILAASPILLELTEHLEKEKAAIDEGEYLEPFDKIAAIKKFDKSFQSTFHRGMCTSVIKKFLELLSVEYLSAQVADQLTKDLIKSARRKLMNYSGYDLISAVFRSALWGNIILYISSFTYDMTMEVYAYMQAVRKSKKSGFNALIPVKVVDVVIWVIKKCGYYTVGWTASSYGFSLGVPVHPFYCGVVISTLLETGATFTYSALVGLPPV